jgi:hypothetical protein
MQHYSNKNAASKRRGVSLRLGVWASDLAFADQGLLHKNTLRTKWDKAKNSLRGLLKDPRTRKALPSSYFVRVQVFS